MFNFSKADRKEVLIAAINELPKFTSSADESMCEAVKVLAIARLNAVEQNGAYISIHAHTVPSIAAQQIEIQITGKQF